MAGRRPKKRPPKDERQRQKSADRLTKAAVVVGGLALAFAALIAALLLGGLIGGGSSGAKTAAIVDQLSLSHPNPEFAASASDILTQADYGVDYFAGEEVTVDFYRNLPRQGYDLIILRVHSGMAVETDVSTGETTGREYISLFSGEPYDPDKYPEEQMVRLGRAEYYPGAPPLFGIAPDFVTYSMRGRFDGTLIVMMGCDGLRSQTMAQAFLDKGASAFVSWSRAVSAGHTDAATLRLLEKLLVDGLAVAEAVAATAEEVGPDPEYGARLRVLPEGG